MNKNFFLAIWNLEVYKINDNSIRISQIIIASLIFFIGIYLSRRVSILIKNKLSKIKYIGNNAVVFTQRIVFNSLVFITILIALPIAGIPMTVFTVLGGVAAIGIGFGMQNLFNNVISSIIIILERPIRVGDIIELPGEKGEIIEIGTRRVKIRRTDGVDVLIPNSYFLEQSLINWTLTDKDIRGQIKIGVAYGSNIEKVNELLLELASKNKRIFNKPEPKVLFENFGDDALEFKLLFWTKINNPIDLEEVASNLRFEIYNEFNKNNITIAFPQRDIHLDTSKALEIRMVKNE